MARKHNLAEVLQTEVTGTMPLKTLAKVLASKGRRGDTILAHITPKEAKKLKKAGGSGTINPETGLPEFFGEDGFDYPTYEAPVEAPAPVVEAPAVPTQEAPVNLPTFAQSADYVSPTSYTQPQTDVGVISGASYQQPTTGTDYSTFSPAGVYEPTFYQSPYAGGAETGAQFMPTFEVAGPGATGATPFGQLASAYPSANVPLPPLRPGATPYETPTGETTGGVPASEEVQAAEGKKEGEGLFGKMSLSDLLKLGVGGIGALMGRSQQQAAIQQAAAAGQQYSAAANAAAQQYQQLVQPLIGPGYTALSLSNQGALNAANRQAFDIARARAAQASARSGGVGAVQTAMEEGRMYQQLVSTQLQQAMQLIAPGNSLASAAISTTLAGQQGALGLQLQLEQQANQAATNMYSAIAKMVA